MKSIFLDYNTTTPMAPSVQEAMLPFLAEYFHTPDAPYAQARAIEETLEDARGQVANLLSVTADEIVFCASGTESCNLALQGTLLEPLHRGKPCHMVISAIEHSAVSQTAAYLESLGCDVSLLPVDAHGRANLDAFDELLRPETSLVSVMLANGETGVIQPVREIGKLCRQRGILLHCDACQAVGKIQVQPRHLNVDLLSFSAHKFYGPKGAAGLYIRGGVAVSPLVRGGGHEHALRSGTENVAAWVAMGKAANLVGRSIDDAGSRLEQLTTRLFARLSAAIPDRLLWHGKGAQRIPGTLSVSFPGVYGDDLLRRVPEIAASTAAGKLTSPESRCPVLEAMGVTSRDRQGTIRLSVGWYTSEEEVDRAANLLVDAWQALRQ